MAEAMAPETVEKLYRKSLAPDDFAAAVRAAAASAGDGDSTTGGGGGGGADARQLLRQGSRRSIRPPTEAPIREEEPDPEATFHPRTIRMSAILSLKRNPPGVSAADRLYADAVQARERAKVSHTCHTMPPPPPRPPHPL
jgi:hypothetical protein